MNGFDAVGEPNKFERAHDLCIDAIAALDRMDIGAALEAMRKGVRILEIEEQFRDARKARA